jgi:hypothetical protein
MRFSAELTASFLIFVSMWCAADKSLLAPWLGMLGCIILVALLSNNSNEGCCRWSYSPSRFIPGRRCAGGTRG